MCACFWNPLCLQFLLRDVFESLICWLDIWLSCMLDCIHIYVSLLEKRFLNNLDTSSIPPRHLAICRALKVFSYYNLNRSSTAGGSNKKVPGPSIASWQLMDRSSFSYYVFALFLYTFSTVVSVDVVFLDTFLDRWLDTSRHLYLSRITEDLYICSSRFGCDFFDFSQSVHSYSSPEHYLSYSKPLP